MVIVVHVLNKDINAKTKDEGLAISQNTTFLSITPNAFVDMAGNNVTAIQSNDAKQAALYVADTTRPPLRSFNLNMLTKQVRRRNCLAKNREKSPSTSDFSRKS